jgi:hypothetical protein
VIPVDTVREVAAHPGLIAGVRYRPSPETVLRVGLRSLPRGDRRLARQIAAGHLEPSDPSLAEIPIERRARILDVAYDQLRYEFLAGQVTEGDSRGLSRRILIARSLIDVDGAPEIERTRVPVPQKRPDEGHESSLLALSGGWRDDESFVEFRWQPAFHDLIDDSSGFAEHMQIRFLDTRLRVYPQSNRVRLQRLTLVEATSLSPRSRVFRPMSYRFGMGLRNRRVADGNGLDDSYVWGTEGGVGLSHDPTRYLLFYGLAQARLDLGSDLEDKFSLGAGGRAGLFLGPTESRWKAHLFGDVTRHFVGDITTEVRAGLESRVTTSRNTALIADATYNRILGHDWVEASLRLNVYF